MSSERDQNTHAYARRMSRVLDYIQEHLQDELSVDDLARVASSSKYHFQRQFTAYTGIPVSKLVRLMRLKRASYKLAFNPDFRVIDVSLDAGFSSPEAFARAFKTVFGQSPSEFRAHPKWEHWNERYPIPLHTGGTLMKVEIDQFPTTRVGALEHRGSPLALNDSVERFIAWRRTSGLSPVAESGSYGVPFGDPEQTPPDEWRFDICGSVTEDVPDNPQGVVTKVIPGGRCAVTEHRGSPDHIGDTVRRLYAEWLPGSGEEPRDFPCFFEYVRPMDEVPDAQRLTLVRLPLR